MKKIGLFTIFVLSFVCTIIANVLSKKSNVELLSVRKYHSQLRTASIQENGFMRAFSTEKLEDAKRVNVVVVIRPGALIPVAPDASSESFFIQHVHYLMTNFTFARNIREVSRISSLVNITVTNFLDENDYLAFALGLYFNTDYVVVAIIESGTEQSVITSELNSWIQKGVQQLSKNPTNHFVAGSMGSASDGSSLTNFMCITSIFLRQILMYTDINYHHPSLFDLLPLISSNNSSIVYSQLPTLKHISKHNVTTSFTWPVYQKCPIYNSTIERKYDVFIRLYKRNYLREQLDRLFEQSIQPNRVYLLQNRRLVDFGFDSLIESYNRRIVYVWNVNWNSFFHLSYLLSSFSPSPFSITYDDDQILSEPDMHKNIMDTLIRKPGIYSLRSWCWCKEYEGKGKVEECLNSCSSKTDLVVNPFFVYSVINKYMWRYDIPMYYCCEEMSLLFTSQMECNIQWYSLNYTYKSLQRDFQDRSTDPYTVQLKERVDWRYIEHDTLIYYIRAGYKVPSVYDKRFKEIKRDIYPILYLCLLYFAIF